jgi:hypothetical protein
LRRTEAPIVAERLRGIGADGSARRSVEIAGEDDADDHRSNDSDDRDKIESGRFSSSDESSARRKDAIFFSISLCNDYSVGESG